ncbi:MAG: 30S ribosomal protein S15 [Lactobacillales bacterium]|jgi:small subunit ribosomal protein S15|nr:30S ribosomal protein S15 [Lactobacillales bacterium]
MSITKEKKQEVISKFATTKGDTGSPEVQIAVLTEEINALSGHLKVHPKDFHSGRGLMGMVANRRRLLNYLKKTDPSRYEDVITRLNLRK